MSTYQPMETIGVSPNFEQEAVRVNVLRMAGVQVDAVLLPMFREEVTPPQVS